MENLSPSLPEKSFHGNCFAGKTISDDVFGGPPKFGVPILSPRVEDYTEIFEGFHASRGSSIPILNLPAVDDEAADLSFDFRASKFDYSEVFGCFNALDFAVSYEGLFKQTNGGDDSSFEAWTPAQSESLSDESEPCACFEKNQTLSSGDLPPLFDGTKKFNILYHMANPKGKEDMLTGMTNVTQPDAVPGYSFTLDESPPAQKMEDEKLHLHLNLNSDFGGKVTEGEKTVALRPNSSFGIQEYANEPRPSSRHGKASPPWKAFISVSDISLRTQPSHLPPPSRPPPTFDDIKGNFSSVNSKLKASKSYTFERMEADSLPAYFDVEIDASSSSAASAVAMKNAEEKAQAQLRSAKELMECKEGLQSHTKLHLETDIEHKGEKTNKFDIFNSFKDEGMQTTCEREGNDTEPCVAERRKNVRNTTQIVSGATDGEGLIHVAVKSALNDHGKEHSSSRGSHKTEGSVAQREVTQFHEVVETKKLKDENTVAQQSKSHDRGQKEKGTGEALERQEYTRSIKEASADPEWEETGEQLDMLKVAKGLNRQKEHQEKANVVQKVHECQEKEKKTRMTLLLGETEKILYELHKCEDVEILTIEQLKENEMVSEQYLIGINEREEYEKIVKEAHDSKENGREIKESFFSEEYEREFKEDVDLVENKGKLKEALELGTEEKQEKECRELEEIEKKQVKTHEIGENKKKTEAAVESDGKTKWSKEVFEQEGNVNRLKVDLKQQENNKEQKGACEAEQNEKSSEKNAEWEENAKKQEKAYDGQESEPRLTDDCESEKNEKRLKEAWEQEEIEKRLQEVDESGDSDKRVEQHFKEKDTKDRSKDASLREDYENRIRDDTNCEGFCRQGSVHVQNKGEENNRKLKLHQGIYVIMEEQKASDGACNLSETKIPQATGVAGHDKIREKLETQKAPIREENERLRTEPKNCKREIEAVEGKNVPIKERVKSSGMDQNDLLPGKTNNGMEDAKESLCLHDSVAKSSEDGISIGGIHIEKSNGVSEITSHTENANILTRKESESRKNIKRIQFAFGQGENKDKFMSSQVVKEWVEHERKFSDVLPAQKFASQIPGKKEMNLNEKLTVEEREKDEKLKRERTLENDCLRRTEEEREREREREKDRMAVDTTTRVAPESAFSEGKDRAERAAVKRATVEVRQRALVEARERLEKASAGVRERLTAEKASMEARLKVERAAVDKATTKARERAFEKAMAEKASFEAREQVERSVADKSSAYSRNRGLRQTSSSSDLQYQSVGSYHDLKYSHSSVHGGLEGESDQRCKARLERHQRTAERAAKALAEKNMRDLLAHKEQVERNRLAETLDVEVKRWSSGKEGNLRALLSTLQYILGPDNGWQPIPLTDVITDVAVKKAYRKATLCVHPDKLQQRGSSIQQKYICEKVFDLLKEAWNKFNSEGR